MPVLFVGHGNPMNAIERNAFHERWEELGFGFPQALFDVRYPAPGDPALADRAKELIREVDARLDPERGLDHGAWSVLLAMYPAADVPVVQLSLDTTRHGSSHYTLAQALRPLRDEGVLILGSGNIVHNLRVYRFRDREPLDWALRCDAEIKQRILEEDHRALMTLDLLGDRAQLAVPTPEHYFPLLYALALQDEGERLRFFNCVVMSSISMTSVVIGG